MSICPLKSLTTPNCSQVKTLVRITSTQISFPGMVSGSLCRNSLVVQTHSFISCLGGWSQTIAGEESGWGGPGLARLQVCGCETSWTHWQILYNDIAYGREMNIKLSGISSGGHSCSQHANCTLPKNLRHLWHCVVHTGTYCPQHKVYLCSDHAL